MTTGSPMYIPGGQDQDRDDDKIYGVSKVLEEVVFNQLVPQEFSDDLKGELQALLPDIVSPALGTFNNSSGSGQEELTSGFLNALENHTNALKKDSKRGFVKVDTSWNTPGRVGLFKVKNQGDFLRLTRGYVVREREFAVRFSNRV